MTQSDLSSELTLDIASHEAGLHFRDLNVIASPAQSIREVFDLMPSDSEQDWSDISARLAELPKAIKGYIDTLEAGIERGITPAQLQVREVAEQCLRWAERDGFFGTLATEAQGTGGVPESLVRDIDENAGKSAAAYRTLATYLTSVLEPVATPVDAVGRDHYSLQSERFLGAVVDLDETYEWGLEELARMVEEQKKTADEVLPGASVREAIAHLEQDPTRKLHGTAALQAWMQETSDRAIEELTRAHFDLPTEVRTLECLIAPTQEGGIYYTGPTDDFSRPGRMWWSVPEGITEFDTWRELTTVYHEGVPGHHLQIGQAVYNRKLLNSWRRLLAGTSGHAEGWALYAERLMEQLGYLDDPADRLGMLDGQRMRAARVVLDIGVHLGKPRPDGNGVWNAAYALEFMRENVNMSDEFIVFEVNRYLGWPGQAPAYKVGQRVWERLRDDYLSRRGVDASLRDFHREALALGGIRLDTLEGALHSTT